MSRSPETAETGVDVHAKNVDWIDYRRSLLIDLQEGGLQVEHSDLTGNAIPSSEAVDAALDAWTH